MIIKEPAVSQDTLINEEFNELPEDLIDSLFDDHRYIDTKIYTFQDTFTFFFVFWIFFLVVLTSGGSQTHSPVVRLAYMWSLVRGSMISTHSILCIRNEDPSRSRGRGETQEKNKKREIHINKALNAIASILARKAPKEAFQECFSREFIGNSSMVSTRYFLICALILSLI